jgi:hypothetical protein
VNWCFFSVICVCVCIYVCVCACERETPLVLGRQLFLYSNVDGLNAINQLSPD